VRYAVRFSYRCCKCFNRVFHLPESTY
jgi:hypothetical protein